MKIIQKMVSIFIISIFVLAVVSFTPSRIPAIKAQTNQQFSDMQAAFAVNPDGSVVTNATLNVTNMNPPNTNGPTVNASARFSKTNNFTLGTINGTVDLPPEVTVPWPYPYNQTQFPTNQTTAEYLSQYNNGILTEKLNATSIFPPIIKTAYPYNTTDFTLVDTYLNGIMHAQLSGSSTIPQQIGSEIPFNLTDVTIKANLDSNNGFKGNITLPVISGLPASSIFVNFEGNRSAIFFTGNLTVIYGTYEGTVVNATNVANLISEIKENVTGVGPSSLYNMTQGTLELTNVEVTNASLANNIGETIDYNASVHGDFAALIAKYINAIYYYTYTSNQYYPTIYAALNSTLSSVNDMSFTLVYNHVQKIAQMDISFDSNVKTLWSNALKLIPPTVPSNETSEINAWLDLENATAYAVQNQSIYVVYSGTDPQPSLVLNATLVENAAQLNNETIRLIPDLYALYSDLFISAGQNITQVQNIMESYLNKTYPTLHSYNTTVNLQNGIAAFRTDFAYEGSLSEQIDAAKSCYLSLLSASERAANMSVPKQLSVLNQTSIDINNMGIYLQYGRDNVFLNVTGIVVYPPTQMINNLRAFKLTNFFNATTFLGSSQPPTEYEKLRIIIHGGSNSTYVIIPSISSNVPAPSEVSLDGRTFTWENTTISSLNDMIFNIAYQGTYENGGTTYSVPILSNSTVSNFNFDLDKKTISFNVTGTPETTGYCNVTIPRSLLDNSTQGQWIIEEDGSPVPTGQYTIAQNANYTFIYITYTQSSHKISILGSVSSVQEMPPSMMPFSILIVSLIAIALIMTQRRKIHTLKTKSLEVANRMLNRLSRTR